MPSKNSRKEITSRRKVSSINAAGRPSVIVIRELACGHEQVELQGSKAKYATESFCKKCRDASAPRAP